MSQKPSARSVPLTVDVAESLLGKMEARRKAAGSISEVVRTAIEGFDFAALPDQAAQKQQQISVRLPAATKAMLVKMARKKGMGVGNLVRLALEASMEKGAKKKR